MDLPASHRKRPGPAGSLRGRQVFVRGSGRLGRGAATCPHQRNYRTHGREHDLSWVGTEREVLRNGPGDIAVERHHHRGGAWRVAGAVEFDDAGAGWRGDL